jgi:hypothetical protein
VAPQDRVYYLVIADVKLNGRRVSIVEDTHDIINERQVIEFVSRTENVQRVIEVNVEENFARDISEDIARALARSLKVCGSSLKISSAAMSRGRRCTKWRHSRHVA